VQYTNAGTFEFLMDPDGRFYFMEVNTRLQVEHPVTEMVTGLDLVHLQILIAAGSQLPFVQGDLQLRGHAIEVRVYAEDPENNFFPSPGKITRLLTPSGPGIREDSGIYEGWTVPIDYDPMLSKVIAYAPTREQAIRRLRRALDEYFIGGIANNLGLFRRILEDEPDIEVTGEAGDGGEAVRLAKELQPNVVVMDCAMPNMNGLQATRKILEQQPQTLVLMLSMHPEETLVRQALDAGARGYVLKNAVDLELGAAIRRVVAGETVLDSQLNRPAMLKGDRDEHLTPRELEILQMIVEGKSNKEIASVLDLSANTVAVHRANIMDALGIHKTAELVVYAIRNGLVNLP